MYFNLRFVAFIGTFCFVTFIKASSDSEGTVLDNNFNVNKTSPKYNENLKPQAVEGRQKDLTQALNTSNKYTLNENELQSIQNIIQKRRRNSIGR